jgi:FK506-binding protein 1
MGLVTDIAGDMITVDANHALAGHDVHVELELLTRTSKQDLPLEERLVEPVETSQEGDGVTFPQIGDSVSLHYTGYLQEGLVKFDSSRDRARAFTYPVGLDKVIQGWDEGVLQMSLGQRAKLYIPAHKAYGANGAGKTIPPNADLVFDVELLSVTPSKF